MAKVLALPVKILTKADAKVLYLESFLQKHIADLTAMRAEMTKLRKHLAKLEARTRLKLVQDETRS